MGKKQFDQNQKLAIIQSTAKIGVREAARIAEIHYTTIYEWKKQLTVLGEEKFLAYEPCIPGRGEKQIRPDQEAAILDIWRKQPGFGPGQVRAQLRRQGKTISIRTIRTVMEANGYQARSRKKASTAVNRFEAGRPLELAQMDILEFFINNLKVFVIILLDDFSRFIMGWRLVTETNIDEVIGLVKEAIDRYGKMAELLTDRGFVFYSWRGINRFEKYLELERIDHTHARAHHPQTLGKVEACNRRIKNELIEQRRFSSAHEARSLLGEWVTHYNYRRAHQGIGGLLTPSERFHGQAEQVMAKMAREEDVTMVSGEVERSILNLMVNASGELRFYAMGQLLFSIGSGNERKIDGGRGGDSDSRPADMPSQGGGGGSRCDDDLPGGRDIA